MPKIKEYLFHAWTKDPVHISSDPDSTDGKLHKGRWRVLKIAATVTANVLSVPQDMIGLAAGAVTGVAAGLAGVGKAFFSNEDCKQAFSKMSTKGATAGAIGGTIAGSVLFFPLALASYGLSWLTARKGEISRSHLMINIALRALNKSDVPAEEAGGPPDLSDNEVPVILVGDPDPVAVAVAPAPAQVAVRSFKDLEKKMSPKSYVVDSLDQLRPNSDWWKEKIREPIVKGVVDGLPFIAIRIVQVNRIDPETLLPEGHEDYETDAEKKRRRLVGLSPKDSGDSIITFVRRPPNRVQGLRWVQCRCNLGMPSFDRITIDNDDNALDFNKFDKLVQLLDGGEYEQGAARVDGIVSTLIWKVWTPESK